MQPGERLGHPRLADVSIRLDHEAVLTEGLSGRPTLQPAQVHPASGELLEQLEQSTRVVVLQEGHQRGGVRSGRRWHPRPRQGDLHETRDRTRAVGHVVSQHVQPELPGGHGSCDGAVVFPGRDQLCCTRRRCLWQHLSLW